MQKQIVKAKEYLEKNAKDEKLLESIPLIKKEISNYESEHDKLLEIEKDKKNLLLDKKEKELSYKSLHDEVKNFKTIFDEKLEIYKQIEMNSSDDMKNEPLFREKLTTLNMLLKELGEYEEIKQKIQNEEQNQTTLTKEKVQLDKNIENTKHSNR